MRVVTTRCVASVLLFAVALALAAAAPADAVDGVIEINQARALAGRVTPTDDPGFPVTIDTSGSYRLTGNLLVSAVTDGIQVMAGQVTLDLNGFTIQGTHAFGSGISGAPWTRIRNGTILGFRVGVLDFDPVAVESVHVEAASDTGIDAGVLSTISDSVVVGIAGDGIVVGAASTVRGCTVNNNAGIGIFAADSALITGNLVNDNHLGGISASSGSSLIGNDVDNNGTAGQQYAGIGVNGATTILDNTLRNNHALGITFGGSGNGYGRNVLSGNNGGDANPQVGGPGSAVQIGINVCGSAPC